MIAVEKDVERLGFESAYRLRYWRQNWVATYTGLACNHSAWSAVIRDVHEAYLFSSER